MCNYRAHKWHDDRHWHKHAHRRHGRHAQAAPYNVEERDDQFVLLIFAPGKAKEDFQVTVKDDTLKVAYRDSSALADEPTQPDFERSFRLNNKVIIDSITATYADGVLKIILPKDPETNRPPVNITVN